MLETKFETLPNGRRLRVARLGAGPPVLLLHGYPDNLQLWSRVAPLLADRFEVFAFDWPGMGYSDDWSGGATPMHMSDRLAALADHWRLDAVSLVGIDMGGQPALAMAARHPHRVERLVVMNSLLLHDEPTSWEIRILRRFGWNRLLLARLPRLVFRRAERTSLPASEGLPADVRADLWNAFQRPEVRRFVSKMCAGYQGTLPGLPELYSQVRCPALALWAERDEHFPPVHAERLHRLLPESTLSILPRAPHWMHWTHGERVAAEITAFLSAPAACPQDA